MSWHATWAGKYDETLIELHKQDGMTASKIADAINAKHGTEFSRNAVIGRLNRLGLQKPKMKLTQKTAARACVTDRLAAGVGAQVQAINRKKKPHGPSLIKEAFMPRIADAVSRCVPILDLHVMECRWPDDDRNAEGQITFCGNRTSDGSSYCPCHAAFAVGPGTQSERSAVRNAQAIVGME